ncbi:MAG: hypothetical protein LBF17_01880 [Mediterranea sp.]|jgi:hypothetical protein|nr:hypothetical protein [Mediterranea sp.]
MQDRELEDLALDLKELLFLLKEAKARKEFLPVAERHINRLMKTLEEIRNGMNTSKSDRIVAPEVIGRKVELRVEQGQKEREKEIPNAGVPPVTVLGEQFKSAAELSKGLTLNDTFRFSRELFNGDKNEMNRVLQEISRMNSFTDVVSYLSSQTAWDEESDAVKDFVELLKKYFI